MSAFINSRTLRKTMEQGMDVAPAKSSGSTAKQSVQNKGKGGKRTGDETPMVKAKTKKRGLA
jgi:hypothetical protein